MSAKVRKAKLAPAETPKSALACGAIADLVLLRIAAEGGATRNMITRDLAPYTANKLSPAEWRVTLNDALSTLEENGFFVTKRGRMTATKSGQARAQAFLSDGAISDQPWQVQRDINLVAKALGIAKLTAPKRKALATPDGIRALIIQKKFGLSAKKCQSPATTRAALAVIALERAFGKKIKTGLGEKANLPAKASRLLAGQLLDPPREFSTDAQLIAHIAAEQIDARQTSVEELRQALLSKLATGMLAPTIKPSTLSKDARTPNKEQSAQRRIQRPVTVAPQAANDTAPTDVQQTQGGIPDLPQFSQIVNATAASCAEGWPGNMKAFISRVWNSIRNGYPHWELSEAGFKSMLVDAHRAGTIILSGADLKNKTDLEDFEKSQTNYKNAVWHFIRVDA